MSDEIREKRIKMIRSAAVWAGIVLGAIAVFGFSIFGAEAAYARLYENRMYPGVRIHSVRVDGLTREEARDTVQKEIDNALGHGMRFTFVGQEIQLQSSLPASGPDASLDLIRYDADAAVAAAYAVGRDSFWLRNAFEQLDTRMRPVSVTGNIFINDSGIRDALLTAYEEKTKPPKDASFSYVFDGSGSPFIHIENERSGYLLEIGNAIDVLKKQAMSLSFEPITLYESRAEPALTRQDLEPLVGEVENLLRRPSITLTYQGAAHLFTPQDFSAWVAPRKDTGGVVTVGFDTPLFVESVRARAPGIEREAKNGSLEIVDGKIASFVPGQNGIALNATSTLSAIQESWPDTRVFPIRTTVLVASLLGDDPERLGIREIIGVGTSNFSGSPANRRFNIKLGAEKVNGTIIPPGGEFSLLQTLGAVNGANGWLPELVIKGNKTTPEYGGGLCQIGTTTFRAALNSGLKITERRNHSYRVRYYEPAGTDATIYEPSPDFRFMNDTASHVLINAYIQGDDVIFEVWGTKDGRSVGSLDPVIYNISSPPPMKLIETLELPPGQKKCTESAHAGADASLTYKVTYADGTVHEEVFISHYRPWQAVCLVGVETLSDQGDLSQGTPTSTTSP